MEFEFSRYDFDINTGEARLEYKVTEHVFVEKFFFDAQMFVEFDEEILDRAMFYLHIACGVSYWKAFCPENLIMKSGSLTKFEANFFTEFYKHGLMQFFYENDLDPQKHSVKFEFDSSLKRSCFRGLDFLNSRVLLPIGGGKDSLVSAALLEAMEVDFDWFCVKSDRIKKDCVDVSGKKLIDVRREFSSDLINLNRSGEVFNGHVPITGILAFVEIVACVLYGYSKVIMSNEHSSSQANLTWKGYRVNHQYSKSLEFEKMFREFLALNFCSDKGDPLFDYFSLLRGFSEYKIASLFADKCGKYFDVFSSCNRNFHLDTSKNLKGKRFCGECEKCAFVYLILSNFIDSQVLFNIFDQDLFKSKHLLPIYKEMCGLGIRKPWECVGSFEESRYALVEALHLGLLSGELESLAWQIAEDFSPEIEDFKLVYSECFEYLPKAWRKFLIKNV